jgi:hypothetical protein
MRGTTIMVDNPIQRGNWFSSLRAWRASRIRNERHPAAAGGEWPGVTEAAALRAPGEVELSRLAMAAPFED